MLISVKYECRTTFFKKFSVLLQLIATTATTLPIYAATFAKDYKQ
ncbi:hypothetical protein HMPREF9419_2073 [Prevotella nigrescens ATCC 33563]|nr:hypothetical protein HMPREF9419_2073 [Prevotella nigrescens ATCC 33563]